MKVDIYVKNSKKHTYLFSPWTCSNENETTVIQQNLNPPVKIYDTKELFTKMNHVNSKFLGVKTIPKRIPRVEYNVVRI